MCFRLSPGVRSVRLGISTELIAMDKLEVGEAMLGRDVPAGAKVWSGRWCHRKKQVAATVEDKDPGTIVRSRWVVRQFKDYNSQDYFSGCPGLEAIRVLMAIAAHYSLALIPGDFSVAFMHTPMTYDEYVEAPPELGLGRSGCWTARNQHPYVTLG